MTTTSSSPTSAILAPPHNLEAERSVLGAVLLTPVLLNTIALDVGLTGEDFYRPWHGQVFTAMCTLEQSGEPIDHLTVADVMRARGARRDRHGVSGRRPGAAARRPARASCGTGGYHRQRGNTGGDREGLRRTDKVTAVILDVVNTIS
jgi:hypothetical protein